MNAVLRFLCLALVFVAVRLSEAIREKITKEMILEAQKDKMTWFASGLYGIKEELSKKRNTNIAKNVIIFIGDGMGVSTVTAARIFQGQGNDKPGEENSLTFETFDNIALSKTYAVDRMTPDSASTATAMLCGSKTNFLVLGLDGNAVYDNCTGSYNAERLDSIIHWAQAAGKRTGIVTTSRITHATPAAGYAKAANRNWEGDIHISRDNRPCKDIARQLIEDNPDINVILGGGRSYFLPDTKLDPEEQTVVSGQRADGRNLIKEWQREKKARGKKQKYVWNRDQFMKVNDNTEYLLGLFNPSHMNFDLLRGETGPTGEPSLAEMVDKAIDILEEGDNGFVLIVEGARIDHGHHYGFSKLALSDTVAFDKAIKVAKRNTGFKDTLMIVTADHSHPFVISGYPERGSDILGLDDLPSVALDGKPMTILQYSNGPGFREPRTNLTDVDTTGLFQYHSGIPLYSGTHTGEDVAIYASGPMSHLINGVKEQSYIAHVMAYSACIGPYSTGNGVINCMEDRITS